MWPIHKKQRQNWKVYANCKYKFYLQKWIWLSLFSTWYDYGKPKDLIKRTQSDKVLKDKAFKIATDPKYDGYQRGLASMIYNFFDKKSASLNKSSGSSIVNEPNYQLTNEFDRPIIRKF